MDLVSVLDPDYTSERTMYRNVELLLSQSNLTDLSLDPVQPLRSPFAGHLSQLNLIQPLTVIDTDTEVESHIHQSAEQLHCCRDTHTTVAKRQHSGYACGSGQGELMFRGELTC